jgi:hypothetical protein
MSKHKPLSQSDYGQRIRVHEQHIAGAEEARGELLLAHGSDDPEVAALEREIAEHRLSINRIEAERKAAAAKTDDTAQREKVAEYNRLVAKIKNDLSPKIAMHAERLVALYRDAAPILVELDALTRDRQQSVWRALVLAMGSEPARRKHGSLLGNLNVSDVIGLGVASAIARTGLGRTGPAVAPWLLVNAPVTPYTDGQMAAGIDRIASALAVYLKPSPRRL